MFNNILSQPAIFIGLIVVIGYILLKRKWYEIAAGFIKAVVGYSAARRIFAEKYGGSAAEGDSVKMVRGGGCY